MTIPKLLSLIATCYILLGQNAFAAVKTYQVTGPIVEVTDKTIVVQKGDERWEIARDVSTKVDGELKVGQKVTIYYRMHATRVETSASTPQSKKAATK